ncbi:MAG: hypothetical protein DI551_01700 [Micavibrio aeruginosavorus]|uniref:Uncharacterized protein n=1 Tax=Micavibrio aeruginosavorus TaxID=349221 RepID=A0A2W5N6J7_9BACT|nr:MAG: hypothetical protein DI551_01700 [Micavibrio aeruginosavorus]
MTFKAGKGALSRLMDFKASEREDDPARIADIRGPYEILHQRKFGQLPLGSWNLREEESRSGLIWQVLSGAMDKHPSFAAAYLSLALDNALSAEDYTKELRSLNRRWGDYLDHEGLTSDHHHSVMHGTYNRVACVQCSTLTALAVQDPAMHDLFVKELLPLKTPRDRQAYLAEKGLMPLLDKMIPDKTPDTKL